MGSNAKSFCVDGLEKGKGGINIGGSNRKRVLEEYNLKPLVRFCLKQSL